MTGQRTICSAAPRWRDQHQVGRRQYHVTDPDGRQFAFCSACCLLSYAIYGLPGDLGQGDASDDLEPMTSASSEAAA